MDKIREKIFKDITSLIATITAILAITLAIIKLLSYSYWKGYLTYFNISSEYIRLNNDNIILELVFYSIIILALLYFYLTIYEFFDRGMKKVANEKGILKKVSAFVRELLVFILLSSILMTSINIPILWASIISLNTTGEGSFIGALLVLNLSEIISIPLLWLTNFDKRKKQKDTEENEEDIESRHATKILLGIVIASFIIAGLYRLGRESGNKKSDFNVVNNGEFVIAYMFDNKCILLSSEIDDTSITIEKNKQKIVDINDIEYEIIKFDSTVIR